MGKDVVKLQVEYSGGSCTSSQVHYYSKLIIVLEENRAEIFYNSKSQDGYCTVQLGEAKCCLKDDDYTELISIIHNTPFDSWEDWYITGWATASSSHIVTVFFSDNSNATTNVEIPTSYPAYSSFYNICPKYKNGTPIGWNEFTALIDKIMGIIEKNIQYITKTVEGYLTYYNPYGSYNGGSSDGGEGGDGSGK